MSDIASDVWPEAKLLSADMSVDNDGICHVSDIKADGLSDIHNQEVAFDPRQPCCVTFLMMDRFAVLDKFSTKCQLRTYNMNTKMTLLQNSCRLRRMFYVHEEANDNSECDREVQEENRCHDLGECYMDYSKRGDVIMLCSG